MSKGKLTNYLKYTSILNTDNAQDHTGLNFK